MNERTTDNRIPFSGGVFGCILAILIPAVVIFFTFLLGSREGLRGAIDETLSSIAFLVIFTGPLGAVAGAYLAAYRRMTDTERKKVTYSLIPVLGGIVGFNLGFWIPAVIIYIASVEMVPGMINGACAGFMIAPLSAVGGVYLAKRLRKDPSKEESSN